MLWPFPPAGTSQGYELLTIDHSTQGPLLAATSPPAGTREGYELFTMDHDTGTLRLDLAHRWDDPSPPAPLLPENELICDPAAGWLCCPVDCSVG